MSIGGIILFSICAALFLGVVYMLWRYAEAQRRETANERAFDRRVARLNERQSNRISDDQLRNPASEDDAWNTLLQRGRGGSRRRERYAGDLERRRRERRRDNT